VNHSNRDSASIQHSTLNHSVVELAYYARLIGDEIESDSVSEVTLDDLREELTEIESMIDEIERRYQ